MLVTCLKIFSGNLYPTSIYSKRAGKTISVISCVAYASEPPAYMSPNKL